MDDEVFAFLLALVLACLAATGLVFLLNGTLDKTVKEACEQNGYWQTGQTRVICSVEKKNAPST